MGDVCGVLRWVPSGHPQPSTGSFDMSQVGSGADNERHVRLHACMV